MKIDGADALVTGAGSGIGRALAGHLFALGAKPILVDLHEENLAETARRLPGVRAHVLDVTDADAVARLERTAGPVDILVNNAGIGAEGTFLETSRETFARVMAVNFDATVEMCRTFLPGMLERDRPARIVNISSLWGILAPAGVSAYAASKFAVNGFSQALRHELQDTQVGVTVVHPGGVATNIAPSSLTKEETEAERTARLKRAERLLKMEPDVAAGQIANAIARDARRVVIGGDALAGTWLQKWMPVRYHDVLKRLGTLD